MKTQISRNSHQPDKGYNGVYQQQGRMLTDADWNELTDIQKQRLVAALQDAIASGAPREQGLAINLDGSIQPGVLYVDGWPVLLEGNSPILPTAQPNYPKPPSFSGKNLRFYADVWERTVTSLEDEALLDPALHGADTCTRVRTMLQVKWCNVSKQPENPAQNPPIGTAELKLKLRKISVEDDPCDPCATQLDLDQRVGNYLFRVEVHDHYWQSGKEFLVLKWSRDSGSEQYMAEPTEELPEGFASGDWVWEFFDLETEKLLGRHYPQNYKPKRGELVTSFAIPGATKPKDFVRQWDGFCTINLTDNLLVGGVDRGATLDPALGPQAHGRVDLSGGSLKVNLELIELELSLGGEAFLAGDYWQAEVREAVDASGDYVLGDSGQGKTPAGIYHHYLQLGQLSNSGALVPLTDEERRRFNFPPLTDIHAADVGFTDNCPGLYAGADNVQQALDKLCAIGAEDIAYLPPDCPDSVRALLQATVAAWPDLDGDGKTSVKDMLDALLCHLSAESLPYDIPGCGEDADPTVRSLLGLAAGDADTATVLNALLCSLNADDIPLDKDTLICTELDGPDVLTVQDALKRLCLNTGSGGGCAVTVEPGELQSQLEAFAASGAEDIWLCLKPGDHPIEAELAIAGKQSIKITGAGERASIIQLKSKQWGMEAREIHIEDLGVAFANAEGQLLLKADLISAEHNTFERGGKEPGMPPMILLDARSRGNGQLHWSDNRLRSTWRRMAPGAEIDHIAPPGVVGAEVNAGFKNIAWNDNMMYDGGAYEKAVEDLARKVAGMPQGKRTAWKSAGTSGLDAIDYSSVPLMSAAWALPNPLFFIAPPSSADTTIAMNAAARAKAAMTAMTRSNVTVASAAENIENLIAQIMEYGFNPALAITSHKQGGRLEGNRLVGELWLRNENEKGVDPANIGPFKVSVDGDLVEFGADLHLQGNEIQRMVSFIASGLVGDGVLTRPVTGYRVLTASDNLFMDGKQSLVAGQLSFQGNHFPAVESEEQLAVVLTNRSAFVANVADESSAGIRYAATAVANTGNLLQLQTL